MKNFISALSGGVVIIVMSTVIGLGHNAVRSNPVKPINSIKKPVATEARSAPSSTDARPTEGTAVESQLSAADVKRLAEEGFTIILDARGPEEYAEGHIPGAINIPYDLLAGFLTVLQEKTTPDQPVLCYCRGPECDLSDGLATELELMGYERVSVFRGGWDEWTGAGYAVVTGTEPE